MSDRRPRGRSWPRPAGWLAGRFGGWAAPSAAVACAALAAWPLLDGGSYLLHVGSLVCVEAILVLGLQVIFGFAGQFSFGHAALHGVGAYTAAILLTRTGAPYPLVVLAAVAAAGVVGLVVGLPALRVGEDYLALVTLGWAEMLRLTFSHWPSLFGDAGNIYAIPRPRLLGWQARGEGDFYLLGLLLLAIALYVVWRLRASDAGLAMLALRDDELAAAGAGVATGRLKLLAFGAGGALAGLGGAFYAPFLSVVTPGSFDLGESFSLVVMLILAGRGSLLGSVLGAALVVALNEALNEHGEVRLGATGLLLLLVVLGRSGLLRQAWSYAARRFPCHSERSEESVTPGPPWGYRSFASLRMTKVGRNK